MADILGINDLLAEEKSENEQNAKPAVSGSFTPDGPDHLEEEEEELEIGDIGTGAADRNKPENLGEIGVDDKGPAASSGSAA